MSRDLRKRDVEPPVLFGSRNEMWAAHPHRKGDGMEDNTITIHISKENAIRLESFLQDIMPTHKFPFPNGGLQMKAANDLYTKLKEALDAEGSK